MKIERVVRSLLGTSVLCWLLASAGCNGTAQSSDTANNAAEPRVDWGMSLLASGSNGLGQFPAKFAFDVNATPDCTNDFVVYNTGAAGSSSTAHIVAFNKLYSTQGSSGGLCAQNGPSTYWAYKTDTSGATQALTSPVLSGDGTRVAFVDTATSATLRILKWKSGQGTMAAPVSPDSDISGSAWSTCMASKSCIVSIAFSGGAADTKSPPYYDYNNDVMYIGDNNGMLHKFTGVFNGTPMEITSGLWPFQATTAGRTMTGAIYDKVSGYIFFGDSAGALDRVNISGSASDCTPQPCKPTTSTINVGASGGGSVVDAPIVDGTNGFVFAVDGTTTSSHGVLLQVPTSLTSPLRGSIGGFGVGTEPLYGGAFDNTFYTTPGSGHMYICGKDNSHLDRPTLYMIDFGSSGVVMSLGSLTGLVSADSEACSPVTEVYNTGTTKDWIFFSIGNNANSTDPIPAGGCRTNLAGCVLSLDVSGGSASWPPTDFNNSASVPANAAGSTSGIVVDNISSSSQASNMYFSLGTNSSGTGPGLPSCNTTSGVGCAVKLTQSALN